MKVFAVLQTRAGEPKLELGAPEPSIFDGAGAEAGAINELISFSSEWLKNLTETSLSFLAQKTSLLLTSLDAHKMAGMSETKKV